MKFLYLIIILFFGYASVRYLARNYDINKAIENKEKNLNKTKDLLNDGVLGEEFVRMLFTILAIIGFFIKAVVLCFAIIGFKNVFG